MQNGAKFHQILFYSTLLYPVTTNSGIATNYVSELMPNHNIYEEYTLVSSGISGLMPNPNLSIRKYLTLQ